MPRPKRCRRVQSFPAFWCFEAEDGRNRPDDSIRLTLDEYEAIRLLDLEGLTQAECAEMMNVSRTTVTAIYERARKKIAECIVNGRRLLISGGDYDLETEETASGSAGKGTNTMRLAVTYDADGTVFQHFGRTEQFKIYDIENGEVTRTEVLGTGGTGHGALAGFLKSIGADALICGGIGGGAQSALAEAGIPFFGGVTGPADEAAKAYTEGKLSFDPEVHCDHHHHEEGHSCGGHHHGEGHSCGGHRHGEGHSCGGHHHGEGCGHK
ncbi:MAG: DUF134 domain-containing protein [Eubacterium pyruvativorans]|uniref:DUF134 domain-containing protein n=1 Tax=Eubacterium pyruvativorans TaxID=155865 RepID=UPI0024090D6E|nr:DUF134 domain-containing protein [Eubacterium pyruvativorans]MDD6707793.1 DUF134 domain-containing protein [Eubacterium pyruvativorans]MDY4048834.1 DUF134 domain-containing protein [Eubacterium pyruvativorans]